MAAPRRTLRKAHRQIARDLRALTALVDLPPTPPTVRQQIDAQRAVYEGILSAWTTATHRQLYRDARRLYAYHVPSTATTYGQLVTVAEDETPPAGAALMDPEPVSGFKTRDQLYAWIKRLADWLPMYPHLER